MKILVVNGPNINLLGIREPDVYGKNSFQDLLTLLKEVAADLKIEVLQYQSNHEGNLVDAIQAAYGKYDGIVINPAAYTHTSIALLDAIRAIAVPVVEVHLSNVHSREAFRHHSMISAACAGVICGFGIDVYRLGVEALRGRMK